MSMAVHASSLNPHDGVLARMSSIREELAHALDRPTAHGEVVASNRHIESHLLAARCIETVHTPYER